VPTEYACNRALPAMHQPIIAPPHATYIVQGSLARRDVKQLWSLLRRTPADVNFTIKVTTARGRQRLGLSPHTCAQLTQKWISCGTCRFSREMVCTPRPTSH
jgi:hypothetical protein